ncbi:LuxR family transcriptional regulator [Amycolatopsis sp. CA-128772]|uniref:helix-turn-helix transcriptional regulator n=1 Tax=Amycolatopsis sp. CA-128772 TaxID=2073159 RepID=UPI001304C577|nr:LuxR family transcriptional regulator [Amycolatopsis sp. CA-128772]
MRESRLVGREHATNVLRDLTAGLGRGRGATAHISGAAGTGRTALLDRVLDAAPGALASCVPDGVPFGAVTQLAAALLPPPAFADLVTACLDDREGAAARLGDAFAGLAAGRPLVLAVDDLQWADEWSLRWFGEMAARTADDPVLLVATGHEPVGAGHRIPLSPLTTGETASLVLRVLGDLPPEALTAVLDVVRGRPAVLHELAAVAGAAGWEDPARVAAAGRAVTSARAARVRRGLPPAALAVLRAMSVSERLDVVAVLGLAGLPPAAVPGALGALEASGLVADGRPVEPHLAADVLAELAEPERNGLHRRAAELAHRTGAGALVAAELLVPAPPVGEPWARAALVEAAEQWAAQGNLVAAAASLQRALAEPSGPAERAALVLRLAATVVRRDPGHADRRLIQVLTEPALSPLPAATTAADLLLARGDAETVHRLVAERESTVDPALVALGRLAREEAAVEPEMPVAALSWLDDGGVEGTAGSTAAPDAGRTGSKLGTPVTAQPRPNRAEAERAAASTATPDANRTGPEPGMPVAALSWLDGAEADRAGRDRATPGTAAFTGPTTSPSFASGAARGPRGLAAPLGDSAAWHSVAAGTGVRRGDRGPSATPAAAGVAAFRLAVRGEQRAAVLELADRALVVREEAALMPRIAACRALLCAGVAGGAVDALGAVLAAARRRDARAAAAQALVHRAAAAVRDDRADEALRDLAAAERELPARCWHPLAVPLRSAVEITARIRLGRIDQARHLADEPLPRGAELGAAAAFRLHAEAELALAEDDPAAALAAALECGRVLRSRGWVNPMITAWRTTAAFALRRLGDREGAEALAAEEQDLAGRWGTAAGLDVLRERVAAGLRRAVPAPRRPADPLPSLPALGPDVLSPAERDVAELAARGLANREIARELAIALRTVELRLTKVYRKLGLKGRAALAGHWPTRTPGG